MYVQFADCPYCIHSIPKVWKTSFGKIKKGGNYKENKVLQADSKGSGYYLWESMIK